MNKWIKAQLLVLPFCLAFVLLLLGHPWSLSLNHKLNKIIVKTEITLNRWRGNEPRLASIVGELDMPGARVLALDSRSGWATFCDLQGKFNLPDVLWYPDATYELVVSTDETTGKLIKVSSPSVFPPGGEINAGRVILSDGLNVDFRHLPGDNSQSYEGFDIENRDYYRKVFDELTDGETCDAERVGAVNDYVATRLNYNSTQWELGSPRRILEHGSQYCGHLSSTMATILAVAFPVRIIHLKDGSVPPKTHAVVEVFYERSWHLYDPTFGVKFENRDGKIASYKELMLSPELISLDSFSAFRKKYPRVPLDALAGIYGSGHHHFYYLAYKRSQYAHAWWAYKDGANYVTSGSRILLAAAGVYPGTNATYHIRKTGSNYDELTLVSRQGATARSVLNEEESAPIDLEPGSYEVFVDLYDGNISKPNRHSPVLITNWHLGVKLEVR